MKVFSKYNRINITATIIIFLAGSCTFYFLLRYILIHQLDETLQTEQQEIVQYVNEHNQLPEIQRTKDQYISFAPSGARVNEKRYSAYRKYGAKQIQYREINFSIRANGTYYRTTVAKPLEETEDLLQIIISVTLGMIALILLAGYFINRQVLGKLWRPFYQTIGQVKLYELNSGPSLSLANTDIDEFRLLNESIKTMTERIQSDYQSLKAFTGQAAHEMQTPLAIIRSKLDVLIQNEILVKQGQQQFLDIENAVQKLSRLYQSLLLLTRIENRQFELNEEIDLAAIITGKLVELSDITEAKQLQLNVNVVPLSIHFHHLLADIIMGNLISNAIRYNMPGGRLNIQLENGVFSIANTSTIPALEEQRVFQRFYRHYSTTAEGNGLGLSIVKQICDLANYSITYTYTEGCHVFTIQFGG